MLTKEDQELLHRLGRMELIGMVIDLETALAKAKAKQRRPSKTIIRTLAACFNAAAAGGFEGDTDDVTTKAAEATRQWLKSWSDS